MKRTVTLSQAIHFTNSLIQQRTAIVERRILPDGVTGVSSFLAEVGKLDNTISQLSNTKIEVEIDENITMER